MEMNTISQDYHSSNQQVPNYIPQQQSSYANGGYKYPLPTSQEELPKNGYSQLSCNNNSCENYNAAKNVENKENISFILNYRELWQKFDNCTNEMVITKTGRRMFPIMDFQIVGLQPTNRYMVYIDFVLMNVYQWKYSKSQWQMIGDGSRDQTYSNMYVHPDSPNTGLHWMASNIQFNRLKLTNRKSDDNIYLTSMKQYQPVIHVVQVDSYGSPINQTHCCQIFSETKFIAVTAYQNTDITQLKIDHNPFARAFRDSMVKRTPVHQNNDNRVGAFASQQMQYPVLQLQQNQQPPFSNGYGNIVYGEGNAKEDQCNAAITSSETSKGSYASWTLKDISNPCASSEALYNNVHISKQ